MPSTTNNCFYGTVMGPLWSRRAVNFTGMCSKDQPRDSRLGNVRRT